MILLTLLACGGGDNAASADVTQLAFLEGYWRAEDPRGLTEEAWALEGDRMRGQGRYTPKGAASPTSTETLRIVAEGDALVYYANPGSGEVPFTMTSLEGTSVVFENPEHDFPQRIAYTVDGGTMTATVSSADREISWAFAHAGEPQAPGE